MKAMVALRIMEKNLVSMVILLLHLPIRKRKYLAAKGEAFNADLNRDESETGTDILILCSSLDMNELKRAVEDFISCFNFQRTFSDVR